MCAKSLVSPTSASNLFQTAAADATETCWPTIARIIVVAPRWLMRGSG